MFSRLPARLCLSLLLAATWCWSQEDRAASDPPSLTCPAGQAGSAPAANDQPHKNQSTMGKLRDLPIQWLIGPYIPSNRPLTPLTGQERTEVYFRQTYFNVGTYAARAFAAGIDQARGEPRQWGGGMEGYGRRFGSRFGQFAIQNTFVAAGNAAVGYEPRYDLCRCTGFWPRTRHAVMRNFVTYNETERERRPQIPLYVGAFGAGMVSSTWLPGHQNVWQNGGYRALEQAGFGSGINWVSEFALDILRKLGVKEK